jgi:hypothetical protein
MTPYKYTASTDFIKNLSFDYVEVYSFQRGKEFEENSKLLQSEYESLKTKKEKFDSLPISEEDRLLELNQLLRVTQYLLDENGQFHPSSKKTHTFKHGDPHIERIKAILLTEITEIPQWLCAPIYRDALVFFSKDNKIVTVLNICLSCQYMETNRFNHIHSDYITYDLFKHFFIDIGHDVENPEYFASDDLNTIKWRQKK